MPPEVKQKFDSYPRDARKALMHLRAMIFEVAKEDNAGKLEETLKWGEPSYRAKGGTTVRIDWKPKLPEQYGMYFHCQTTLVATFREIYDGRFHFQGNRAIVFNIAEAPPKKELKHCISMALRYHKMKKSPA